MKVGQRSSIMNDPWELVQTRQYEAAIREYSRLHETKGGRMWLFNRGITYLLMTDYPAALADFKQMIETEESRLRGDSDYIHSGICCWCMNRTEEALRFWREGLTAPYTDAGGGVAVPALLLYGAERLQDRSLRNEANRHLKRRWQKHLRRQPIRHDRRQITRDDLIHPGLLAWPGAIVPFLLGKVDQTEFWQNAGNAGNDVLQARWQCAAHFYVGLRGLCEGNFSEFQDGMNRCATSGHFELEHVFYLARWEVERGFRGPGVPCGDWQFHQ
jgi:hypothetical protein